MVNASLKSERSLTCPIFSKFIERDPPILFVSKVLFLRHSIGENFLRVLVHLDTDFFSSTELSFTKFGIFLESIVNPLKTSLDASLSQIMGNTMVFLFFSLPKSIREDIAAVDTPRLHVLTISPMNEAWTASDPGWSGRKPSLGRKLRGQATRGHVGQATLACPSILEAELRLREDASDAIEHFGKAR